MALTQEKEMVLDQVVVREELALVDPKALMPGGLDEETVKKAESFLALALSFDPSKQESVTLREQLAATVEKAGTEIQKKASRKSAMLKEPIRTLSQKGEDGGEVANALVELNMTVEDLDPGNFDFEAGWFGRALQVIPGVGKPIKKYFLQFESAQTVIDAIFRSLEKGADVLKRDNITLTEDQKEMRQLTIFLENQIKLFMEIDARLAEKIENEITSDDPRRAFLEEEIIFALRQRIQDLQQQLAVNQQGVLAIELIVRNNKELIRGVARAMNVTVNALNIAVVLSLALANQKIVLDKVNMVNKTTNKLLEDNARRLKMQGVAIHKQATEMALSMDSLKKSFADIRSAIEDVAAYRRNALPVMAQNILEMDKMAGEAEAAIRRMEEGDRIAPSVTLDVFDGEFKVLK